MLRQRRQQAQGQFPVFPGPVLGAFGQNFGREHAVDFEQLELDRVAAGVRRRIDKRLGAGEVASMVAGSLSDEKRAALHLTISKERKAKKRLMSRPGTQKILRDGAHLGPAIAERPDHSIIDCQACGFRHALPLPDATAMAKEYRENYYATEKPNFLLHAGEDQDWFLLSQTDKLEMLERLLPPSRRRLLDVGCGPGFFLSTAIKRGWQAHGIEPSRQAAAHARELGAAVTEGFFDAESAAKLGHFDSITLTNMLEHVPDPLAILTMARGMLEPGGAILVGVPNDFSPMQLAARAEIGLTDRWGPP